MVLRLPSVVHVLTLTVYGLAVCETVADVVKRGATADLTKWKFSFHVPDIVTDRLQHRHSHTNRLGHCQVSYDMLTSRFMCSCKLPACLHVVLVLLSVYDAKPRGVNDVTDDEIKRWYTAIRASYEESDAHHEIARTRRKPTGRQHPCLEAQYLPAYRIRCMDEIDLEPFRNMARQRRFGGLCDCSSNQLEIANDVGALAAHFGLDPTAAQLFLAQVCMTGRARPVVTRRADGSCVKCQYPTTYSVTEELGQQLERCLTCQSANSLQKIALTGAKLFTEAGVLNGITVIVFRCANCQAVYAPNDCRDNVFFLNHREGYTLTSMYDIRQLQLEGGMSVGQAVNHHAKIHEWDKHGQARNWANAYFVFELRNIRISRLFDVLGAPDDIKVRDGPFCIKCGDALPMATMDNEEQTASKVCHTPPEQRTH